MRDKGRNQESSYEATTVTPPKDYGGLDQKIKVHMVKIVRPSINFENRQSHAGPVHKLDVQCETRKMVYFLS